MRLKLLILIVTGLIFISCDNTDDQRAADLTIPVQVQPVNKGQIASHISATGTLKAARQEQVVTLVSGVLHITEGARAAYESGKPVRKDQLIARLENPEHELSTRVQSQRMAMEDAQRELEKQEALFKEGGITEKELQLTRRNALDARLNYQAALINQKKLALSTPIAGTISGLHISAHSTRVQAGFQVCTVTDFSDILLEVNLPNSDLSLISDEGQRVEITNYAFEYEIFTGTVKSIDPSLDPKTRTFKITIAVDNPNRLLRPGMFVKADIILEEKPDALVIPKSAILVRNNQKRVYIAEGATARERDVVTGIETREEVEILSGLEESEQLIVKGHETLKDKSKIRVRD